MARPRELAAMRRALALAAGALDATSPNPLVGCVILDRHGRPAGEGATRPRGGPHAEAVALKAAGELARGGTAVVTLEPCQHTGRTGPCAAALAAAGVARVVHAVDDPEPSAGGGGGQLRAAGIDVEAGVLAAEARAVNPRWLAAMRAHRPFVTWKYGATLDGRVAAGDGTSRWITGEEARREVHMMRARHDAVLVGVGTVLADDPALTARDIGAAAAGLRQPLRVVLDSAGRTPAGARVRDETAATRILTADDVPPGDGGLDVGSALKLLWDDGVRSVLLEGGPRLAGNFARADAIDRVVGYVAPALLGAGSAALGDVGVTTIAGMMRLAVDDVGRAGEDIRVVAHPAVRQPGAHPAGTPASGDSTQPAAG